MAFSVETIGRLLASGRNYASQIIGIFVGIGIMSAAQQHDLMQALSDIIAGISQMVHGATSAWQILVVVFGPIIGAVVAKWASNSAKTDNQAKALSAAVADPNTPVSQDAKAALLQATATLPETSGKIVVTDQKLAEAVPSNKVVSQ